MNVNFNPVQRSYQSKQQNQQPGFSGEAKFHNPLRFAGEMVDCLQVITEKKEVQSFARRFRGLGAIAEEEGVSLDVILHDVNDRRVGWEEGMAHIEVKATTDETARLPHKGELKDMPGSYTTTVSSIRAYPSEARRQRNVNESLYIAGGSGFPARDPVNEPTDDMTILGTLQQVASEVAQKAKQALADAKEKFAKM